VKYFGVVSPNRWKKYQMKIGVQSCEGKYADCGVVNLQWKNTPKYLYFQ
jgi:hypothetical protein